MNKLKKIIGMGLCACLLLTSLVGCGANKKEQSVSSKPQTSKVLTTASGAEINTLYPLNMDIQNQLAAKQVYEGLVTYEEGKVVPSLAESWEFNKEGTQLTFHLKKGVKFHDGTPFNAEAVKANYEFAKQNPNFGNIKGVVSSTNIEVVDEFTVKFIYSTPYFAYIMDFCHPDVMAIVSPKVIEAGNYKKMKGVIGTGPYKYGEYKAGEYTKLTKNDDYWGDKAYYNEIIIKYIPESSSRLQALKNGEIDMIFGSSLLTWDDYKQITEISNIQGIVSPYSFKTNNLVLNASSANLKDIKIREAIAYGIDKKAISEGLTYGNETSAECLFDKGIPYTDFDLNVTRSFNKEKANSLLDEAGWMKNNSTGIREKDGKKLSLKFTYNSGDIYNKSLATVIKSQLLEIGIDIQTEGLDMMAWWKGGSAGEYDITIWNTEQPYTTPHGYFTPMVNRSPHAPSIANLKGKDEFIASINKFQTLNDKKQVSEIFKYLINWSNDNVIDVPLTYGKDTIVYNKDKIQGYDFTSTSMFFEAKKLKVN